MNYLNTKMIGPSSQISKVLVFLLLLLLCWYVYMDVNLYLRVQNYPIEDDVLGNNTKTYADVTWVGCELSPLCEVTPKALLLDQTNHLLFAPLVKIVDNLLKISDIQWITPNSISFFHVGVAILAGKCISSDSLPYRRIGVALFEFRTFLDDLDGHVARVRKNIKGELSEVGTTGYYVDGICDGLGTIALMIGVFLFLKNNPPRRGYMQLPTNVNDNETTTVYRVKVTTKKVAMKVGCFTAQLLLSSMGWNRYIASYQDMLGEGGGDWHRRNVVLKSSFFFTIVVIWRVVNVHNMMHFLLLAIFCDKLWEFLKFMQYVGFGIVLTAICISEIHVMDVRNFLYRGVSNSTTY